MKNQPINSTHSSCLRVYVAFRQPIPGVSFWHRFFGPDLGHQLLKRAKQAGIQQAMLLPVSAGYLTGQAIPSPFAESTPVGHPLCLELLDTHESLLHFVDRNQDLLAHAKAVFINPQTFERLT